MLGNCPQNSFNGNYQWKNLKGRENLIPPVILLFTKQHCWHFLKKKKKFKPTRKIRQHLDYHTQIMVKCVYQCLEPFWQYIRGIIGFIAVISVALVFVLITYFHRSFWPLLTIVYYLNSSFIDHAYCNHVCRVIQK